MFIAVDVGAGSGRVFVVDLHSDEMRLHEVHRFVNSPREIDGHLRWDFTWIFENIIAGLRAAGIHCEMIGQKPVSVGVDCWAVDYGLISSNGDLVADPFCYRDGRTLGSMADVFETVSRDQIFERTGIQFQRFNTLYQLCEDKDSFSPGDSFLLLPDLINFFLTGIKLAEYTNATTTQMVNAETGDWDVDLLGRLKIPVTLFPNIVAAGSEVGRLTRGMSKKTMLRDLSVVAPATHDTASAIAAVPLEDGQAFISSGTWSLVGIETNEPVINNKASEQNFTNEGGVYGTFGLLKNVMGLWIFESCRKEWEAQGFDVSYESILGQIESISADPIFIFPDDPRFLDPPDMLSVISEQVKETGQQIDMNPVAIAKTIFCSLAFRYASVLRSIEELTGRALMSVAIIGGGSQNRYLNQITANATGLPIKAGLPEATIVGNACVQAVTAGRFRSHSEAREYVKRTTIFEEFLPQKLDTLGKDRERYTFVESKYLIR